MEECLYPNSCKWYDAITLNEIDNSEEDVLPKVEKEKPKIKDPVTKAAVAKKILKKGIKANQVLKFDEEGDAIENVNTQKISQEGKDYDDNKELNESSNGGINIAEAARILKAEDLYDKQIEREKVRPSRNANSLKWN